MATSATYAETNESRLVFHLVDEGGTARTTRTIALPQVPDSQSIEDALSAFETFATKYTAATASDNNIFVQPANWRDDTGSTLGSVEDPWTTESIDFEVYQTQKTTYTVAPDDPEP